MSTPADLVHPTLPGPAVRQSGRRHVAPAGTPIRLRDLASASRRMLSATDPAESLRRALSEAVGVRHAHLVSTGRAALTMILETLRQQPSPTDATTGARIDGDRDEVILPSYTCYSVAASIVKAGLRPRIVDVDPQTMDFDPDCLARADKRRVLGIVATNLYGTPSNLPVFASVARSAGVYLVDDAAQALGARIANRAAGTWGDVGLYSFDKGKNVAAIDGGAIVTDSEALSDALATRVAGLPGPAVTHTCLNVVKALTYAAFLRPALYWIPNGIPQLGLGTTVYATDFPVHAASRPLTALAATMIGHLNELGDERRGNAARLEQRLERVAGITLPAVPADVTPACLRFPFLAPDAASKNALVAALNATGIGATGSYPSAIADVPELRGRLVGTDADAAGGRDLAARIVTLPTHAYVTPDDIDTIGRVIERTLAGSRALSSSRSKQ